MDQFGEFPVFRSLLGREMVMGVPRKAALFLGIITMAMVVSLSQYWFLFVAVPAYFGMRRLTKEDEWFPEIIIATVKSAEEYD